MPILLLWAWVTDTSNLRGVEVSYSLSPRDVETLERVVANFPPLSVDQKNRLRSLIGGAR